MPANEELNIVLKLIDQASGQLKGVMGDASKGADDLKNKSDAAGKTLTQSFKDSGKELRTFRREMFAVSAEIAFLSAAVKVWGDHNQQTKDSLERLGINSKNLFALFGSLFAPAINALSEAIRQNMAFLKDLFTTIQQGYTWLFEKISFATQYWISFMAAFKEGVGVAEANKIALADAGRAVDEMSMKFKAAFTENIPQVDAMKNQLRDMNDALEKINLMYLTGGMTAQQYYDILSSNNVANFQNMQTQMGLMQQLSQQENLMQNKSLMDYSADVQAKMGLMKTLQDYHHTVYSSMMDFTDMFIKQFSSGMTNALTAFIMRTKTAGEAFKEFGISMITAIVEFVIQYSLQMLIAAALSSMITASTVSQATTIAAAWLPAAIFASIATMGGAAAAGTAGLSAASAAGIGIGAATMAVSKAIDLGSLTISKPASGGAGGGFAEGGVIPEYIVGVGMSSGRRYTFGENGPETVIPGNRVAGQTSIHIEINNPVLTSHDDIDYLTEEISRKLAREAERI